MAGPRSGTASRRTGVGCENGRSGCPTRRSRDRRATGRRPGWWPFRRRNPRRTARPGPAGRSTGQLDIARRLVSQRMTSRACAAGSAMGPSVGGVEVQCRQAGPDQAGGLRAGGRGGGHDVARGRVDAGIEGVALGGELADALLQAGDRTAKGAGGSERPAAPRSGRTRGSRSAAAGARPDRSTRSTAAPARSSRFGVPAHPPASGDDKPGPKGAGQDMSLGTMVDNQPPIERHDARCTPRW